MNILLLDISIEEAKRRFNIDGNFKMVNSIDELKSNVSDILIAFTDSFTDLYNDLEYYGNNEKYKKFDRLNRKVFNNYKKVFIISLDKVFYKYKYKSLYSNLYFIDDGDKLDLNLKEKNKISNIKKGNILRLKDYVDKQDDYFDSEEIMQKFNVSNRWVKRYMKDMNDIFNNIGYSYSKRKWYKVKK